MRSLRLRLILGVSLVALVPLGLGMFVLSRRIEHTVRAQAAERLDAALGALRLELRSDGTRIAEQLRILARDPVLRRLVLLRPAGDRDLTDYLVERRFLLGLDVLSVADTSGSLIASAERLAGPARADESAWRGALARPRGSDSVMVESLDEASELVMDARAPILYETLVAGRVLGGRALDAALLERLERTSGVELALTDASGRVVVSAHAGDSSPHLAPSGGVARVTRVGRSYLGQSMPLEIGTPPYAVLTGFVPTAPADQTIRALQLTSLLLSLLGLAIAILLGLLWSSQISRPVERLAAYSQQLARGEWDEPLTLRSVQELETLVTALDRMRLDLRGYRDRLIVSERHAAWSQMARRVAHEVKNPLTPIAISVADLKRSYELGRADFPQILDQAVRTVGEEIATLSRLLQEFSEFGRLPAPRFERCRVAELLSGLGALYGRDVAEGRVRFSDSSHDATLDADPEQLRQALINLIKNGLEATASGGGVIVEARADDSSVAFTVSDSGQGLSDEQRAGLFVPGFTTKTQGSGLGLAIVERIVSDHAGSITVEASSTGGTTFRIRLPRTQGRARDRSAGDAMETR